MNLIAELNGERFKVETLRLEPGDKVVLSAEKSLSIDHVQAIKESAEHFFPDNEVIVLSGGLHLSKQEMSA